MLDLICILIKYCLYLTLIRLISSAFNWEFGISRQYLRALEWIFELGQERIKRVDSKHQHLVSNCSSSRDDKLTGQWSTSAELDDKDKSMVTNHGDEFEREVEETAPNPKTTTSMAAAHLRPNELDLSSSSTEATNGLEQQNGSASTVARQRRLGVKLATPYFIQQQQQQQQQQQLLKHQQLATKKRMRRVSTPDGPPVFLLDDIESDDDDDDDRFQDNNNDNDNDNTQQNQCSTSNDNQQTQTRLGPHNNKLHEFHMDDAARFVCRAIGAIIDDEVTKRFSQEQLKTWNLLTRSTASRNYQFMSRSLGLCWLFGLVFRYFVLLPLRICFTLMGFLWLILTMTFIGLMPPSWRSKPYKLCSLMAFRLLSCGITSKLTFHNQQYKSKLGDICVANHTSPIDVVLLACDNCYALVGQRHAGLLGLLERTLSRATNHVWFDRGEMRDRQFVTQRLKQHVSQGSNLPVLIFPEGTCINNSAVMMFRKGSFETTNRVCPVAIKYDARFGDPFWNSSKQSYAQYLLLMMSSWAIKCDVWYLPPMERLDNECSAEFANRVKAEIAKQGGLRDLAWDGLLKRSSVKPTWLYQQQEDYARRLKLE